MRKSNMEEYEIYTHLQNAHRSKIYHQALEQVWTTIETTVHELADGDLITPDSLREYLCRRIVERNIVLTSKNEVR